MKKRIAAAMALSLIITSPYQSLLSHDTKSHNRISLSSLTHAQTITVVELTTSAHLTLSADGKVIEDVDLYATPDYDNAIATSDIIHIKMNVPDTVKEIGHNLFFTKFASAKEIHVTLPDSIEVINSHAFAQNHLLTKVYFNPNLKHIHSNAFLSTNLKGELDFSNTKLETIANSAFAYNENLESVIFPDTIKTIANMSFLLCYNLENVEFKGDNDVFIGTAAFEYNNIKNLKLPSKITKIDSASFSFNNMRSIEVPDTLKVIEDTLYGSSRAPSQFWYEDEDSGNTIQGIALYRKNADGSFAQYPKDQDPVQTKIYPEISPQSQAVIDPVVAELSFYDLKGNNLDLGYSILPAFRFNHYSLSHSIDYTTVYSEKVERKATNTISYVNVDNGYHIGGHLEIGAYADSPISPLYDLPYGYVFYYDMDDKKDPPVFNKTDKTYSLSLDPSRLKEIKYQDDPSYNVGYQKAHFKLVYDYVPVGISLDKYYINEFGKKVNMSATGAEPKIEIYKKDEQRPDEGIRLDNTDGFIFGVDKNRTDKYDRDTSIKYNDEITFKFKDNDFFDPVEIKFVESGITIPVDYKNKKIYDFTLDDNAVSLYDAMEDYFETGNNSQNKSRTYDNYKSKIEVKYIPKPPTDNNEVTAFFTLSIDPTTLSSQEQEYLKKELDSAYLAVIDKDGNQKIVNVRYYNPGAYHTYKNTSNPYVAYSYLEVGDTIVGFASKSSDDRFDVVPTKMEDFVPYHDEVVDSKNVKYYTKHVNLLYRVLPTPSTGGGSSTTPSTGGGSSTTPSTGGGSSTTPSTGGGSSTTPSTGGGSSTTPSTGGGSSTTPSTGGGSSTTPSTGGGSSTTPSTGGGSSTTPSTGGGSSTTPSTGGGSSTTPSTGGGSSTTPSTGGGSTTPSTGGGSSTTPSTGGGSSTTPSTGGGSTTPSTGGGSTTPRDIIRDIPSSNPPLNVSFVPKDITNSDLMNVIPDYVQPVFTIIDPYDVPLGNAIIDINNSSYIFIEDDITPLGIAKISHDNTMEIVQIYEIAISLPKTGHQSSNHMNNILALAFFSLAAIIKKKKK